MTATRRSGCRSGQFTRARSYFADLRFSSYGVRGASELIEGLADLGAPCSVVAAYLDTTAEVVLGWHESNAELPVIVWDTLIDLGSVMIREGEIREARREALNTCECRPCQRRRAGKRDLMLIDIFAELVGVGANYAGS